MFNFGARPAEVMAGLTNIVYAHAADGEYPCGFGRA